MKLSELERHASCLAPRAWPEDANDLALVPRLVALLPEESGELAQAVRLLAGPRMGHPGETAGNIEQVEDELGDALFVLARIALATGASLERAAQRVIGKIERRVERHGPVPKETCCDLEAGGVMVPVDEYRYLAWALEQYADAEDRMGNYDEKRDEMLRSVNARLRQYEEGRGC